MSPSGSRPSTPQARSHSHSHSSSPHQPSTSSRLKHAHAPGSPHRDNSPSPPFHTPATTLPLPLNPFDSEQRTHRVDENSHPSPATSTPFRPQHWRNYSTHNCSQAQGEPCEHGRFSPKIRPTSPPTSVSSTLDGHTHLGHGGRYPRGQSIVGGVNVVLGDAVGDTVFGDGNIFGDRGENGKRLGWSEGWRRWWEGGSDDKNGSGRKTVMSTTRWLATTHGIKNKRRMYLVYYFPFLQWVTQYRWAFFKGDLIAALTMASFYLPMSLSYASNLGHIPPINGLYSFVFNPFVYALFGSCPQMVVGPEAAGSLLLGSVIKSSINGGNHGDDDDAMNARVAGVVTGMAGAVIFIAGITRLGFLDSVLSRPFLRGFISAIGFVILVDQLIPEMGLGHLAKHVGGAIHGSSLDKIIFLVENVKNAHGLTCAVAFGSFAVIMVCRELKRRLQPRIPSVAYVPDRFIVVILSAVLTWHFGWDKQGLDILGDVKSSTGSPFPFRFPFIPSHMHHVREAMSTSFLIALLGFFESSVAAKSLGEGGNRHGEGLQGMSLSANRELVALGVANVVGGCFMALPAFGGYGRSKVNAATGGKTPMSSILLSIITVICILFLLPYFYYLPKCVLSSMISVVAYSLIEEAPPDILFFARLRAYPELFLMTLIFLATVFYSLTLGIALGIGLSLLAVVRHATKPRIQILGRVPGTSPPQFENAELSPERVESVEGCLIVKIPEPLTFANTGELKNRLRRLELYGTTAAHPALPRVRDPQHNSNVIFDVHGVTGLDGSGTQVLREIVDGYVERGVRVFFCRCPREESAVWRLFEGSGVVARVGGRRHFVRSVEEALRMTELERLSGEDFA
ncbi:MAG: hypothetical protein LQ345_002844 [Seirophora villosa]|nr:MAG: hypothetical protein LQ345_002844 [Seirophora villosa]